MLVVHSHRATFLVPCREELRYAVNYRRDVSWASYAAHRLLPSTRFERWQDRKRGQHVVLLSEDNEYVDDLPVIVLSMQYG